MMEVDDANGILLTLMYATEVDLAGIVATAGMWHFEGDGEHTLGEITPNPKNNVTNASELTSFRPAETNWVARMITTHYAEDYPYLVKNDPNYPSPEELLAVYAEGNTQFEGDVRFDTAGSELIKNAILDDDERTLYIHHWGGSNTTVRALLNFFEEYHDTDQWDAVLAKVVGKVVMVGRGEDNCVDDQGIPDKFPGLVFASPATFFNYGSYGAAVNAAEELLPYYQSDYLLDAFKRDHGQVLGHFHLSGDGQVIYGEPMVAQYGLKTWVDFKELRPTYSGTTYPIPRWDMDRYDWLCCQFASWFIDVGLRSDVTNSSNHYVAVMFDELAARADWAVSEPEACNHAPVVSAETQDLAAAPGAEVSLTASASDPDGNELNASWYVPANACVYAAKTDAEGKQADFELPVAADGFSAVFTVPEDAASGDRFVVKLEVQDTAERPMTRFAQFVITVE